jgi:hypothetical protein
MKRNFLILAVAFFALSTFGQARSQPASGVEDLSKPAGHEPPMLGIHWARGLDPYFIVRKARHQRSRKSVNMSWHGGNIIPAAVTENIFWGKSWPNYLANGGDEVDGLDAFYDGFNGSNYAATSDEYTGTNGQVVGPYISHQGHVIDSTVASGGNSTSAILAEVCKEITPDTSGNGYYSVYTDLPRGHSGYCAWHSWGSCNGIPVQFAFFWKLDGDAGCDPQSTVSGKSEGLKALANVSGHELSEARTDPTGSGWYDSSGAENGDKCAWTFNVPYVVFSDGSKWKIQGEWSNAAYTAGTGYPNSSGQKGCLDGQ